MSHDVLHIEGEILVGPDDTRPDVWVVDGRISYAAPGAGADVQTVRGWVLPGLVDAHCHVGLDAHGREVAVRGWVAGSGRNLLDLAQRFAQSGVSALVVTEIGRDGTLTGPNLHLLREVCAATDKPVVASGGVGRLRTSNDICASPKSNVACCVLGVS